MLAVCCCTVGMCSLFLLGANLEVLSVVWERRVNHKVGVDDFLCVHAQQRSYKKQRPKKTNCLPVWHCRAKQGFCAPWTPWFISSDLLTKIWHSPPLWCPRWHSPPRNTPDTVVNSSRPLIIWSAEAKWAMYDQYKIRCIYIGRVTYICHNVSIHVVFVHSPVERFWCCEWNGSSKVTEVAGKCQA